MARGCFVYQKPEKIRWLDGDKLQAKVGGSKWIGFAIQDFKKMVEEQCDIAEKHLGRLGVPLTSPADLEHVQDRRTKANKKKDSAARCRFSSFARTRTRYLFVIEVVSENTAVQRDDELLRVCCKKV